MPALTENRPPSRPAADQPHGRPRLKLGDEQFLRSLPLFDKLEDQQVARILDYSTVQRFPPGTLLFEQGDHPDCLHLLISGTVELFTSPDDGRECGILLMGAGDIFMPAASLFNEPYLNSARTLTLSRVLLLNAAIVRREFNRSHPFAVNMSGAIAGQFRMATRHIIDLKCRSAPQRLAAFLLRLVDESPFSESAMLPVQKRQLASRVGMSPETLSRTLQILAENGLVVRGAGITVRDRKAIHLFCGAPPYPDNAEAALGVHAR